MMTDKQYKQISELISTVKIICFVHDHVKPHMWKDLHADMKNLGEFFNKRITDGIISMSIAIMMRDYKTAELGATEILASIQRINKWRADLLTQKQCQ